RLNGSGRTLWQTENRVYADSGAGGQIHCIDKETGGVICTYGTGGWVFSCTSSPNGAQVFAASNDGHLYGFAENGDCLWKLATRCGTALRMWMWEDRLYMVTTRGFLACLDMGDRAIRAAQAGQVPEVRVIKAPRGKGASPAVERET